MSSSASTRFIHCDPEKLREEKYAKSTVYNNDYAKRLFIQFIEEKQAVLEKLDKQQLGDYLSDFYASLRKEDGSHLTMSSLTTIRYSLARILKKELTVDILKDQAFLRANEVFSGKLAFLKKEW